MSWSDKEIDQLFRSVDSQQDFSYDLRYFDDIERQLPIQRSQGSLFWWVSSFIMFGSFSLLFFIRLSDGWVPSSPKTARNESVHQPVKAMGKSHHVGKGLVRKSKVLAASSSSESLVFEPEQFVSNHLVMEGITGVEDNLSELSVLELLPLDSLDYVDEAFRIPDPVKFKNSRGVSWYLALNSAFQQAWTRPSAGSGWNNVFSVSSGIEKKWGNWLIGAGISFAWKDLSQLEIRERTKIYGLGYATYDNAYSFSGVATVSVPLSVAYKIGRHEMGIGLDVGRNVFATMRRVQSMDGEVFHITQGITDVSLLNKYSLQPGFNYAYRMNEQVSVWLHMNCQMIRPLSSDRFEGIQKPNPWSFGITLKATLIQ